MPRSHWKINLDASDEKNASVVMSRCIKLIDRPPMESNIEKYSKGGYMATFELYHDDELTWPEIIFEVLRFCERIGYGWLLTGRIECDPSGVISKEANARMKIAGVVWAEWNISNEQ